jgi:hypothetical protein
MVVLGINLAGSTVALNIQRSETTSPLVIVPGIITDPGTGTVRFDFVPATTAAIPAGFYIFTIVVTTGTNTNTASTGQFILDPFDQDLIGTAEPIMTIAVTGSTERLTLETRDSNGVLGQPSGLSLSIIDPGDITITSVTYPDPSIMNPAAGVFQYDLTSNRAGDFLAVWSFQFPNDEPTKVIKNVRFITPSMFRMSGELLLYIDKARKSTNKPIGYSPADAAEYIEMALRDFNAQPPSTSLVLEDLDGALSPYKNVIIRGATIQALVAQGLLSVDQDFSYSDGGITLAVNHNAGLQSWYQVLLQQYIADKRAQKMDFFHPAAHTRVIVGTSFALAFAKLPPGSAARFRGWI